MKCCKCSYASQGWFAEYPEAWVCIAVKEPFIISDLEADCTEYPAEEVLSDVPESQVMNTAEMWLKAQNDGKIYECIDGDIAYSKKYGLTDKYDFSYVWELGCWDECGAHALDDLLGNSKWQEMKNVMTAEEAEEKFGIRIVLNK